MASYMTIDTAYSAKYDKLVKNAQLNSTNYMPWVIMNMKSENIMFL